MTARTRTRLLALLGACALVLAPLLVAAPAHADPNNFSYASWDSVYELGKDDVGRATLTVTETLVADFPDFDQNHGIIRGLPEWYDGAPLGTHVVSVTDEHGKNVPYDDGTSVDGEKQVKIGDGDVYQHGLTSYTIRYTMRDVVHRPTDRKIDEWYWDLLPLNSSQPIAKFTGELRFAPQVGTALTGDHACYVGPAGSTAACALEPAGDGTGFRIAQSNIPAGSGITVAFALQPDTFAPAPARTPDPLTDTVPVPVAAGGTVVAIGGAILGIVGMRRRARRTGRGIVVAQYDVPPSLPPLLAALIEGRRGVATSAEIVHLAVRSAIRIEDGHGKPTLTLLDPSIGPDPLDAEALAALFPHHKVGTKLLLAQPNDLLVGRLRNVSTSAREAAFARDLLVRKRSALALTLSIAGLVAGVAAAAVALTGLLVGRPAAIASFVIALVVAAIALPAVFAARKRYEVLTPAGAEAREYLLGVREYIRLAEADRIRMLQSYTGAERRRDGTVDVVVLYERLLPYAMLFGMEREWGAVLTVQYEQNNSGPGWYVGYSSNNFSGSLSGMSNSLSATSTPSTSSSSSSSSSSSGSFGGGSSGGGGGGGSSSGW